MNTSRFLFFIILLMPLCLKSQTLKKESHMIPMRDGISLATDVYMPENNGQYPVVMYRTPYNKSFDKPSDAKIREWNNSGYVIVLQDCRGRYASEGADSLFLTDGWGELQDGYDTVEWIVNQSWCNSKVGMYGFSAPAITTTRAVGALHPNLVCAASAMAPSDFYNQIVYPGGEMRKSLTEFFVNFQQSFYMLDYFKANPYYNSLWEGMNLHTRTSDIKIPILHFGGWYDCFSDGTIAAFTDLASRQESGAQKLIMGPWTHAFGFGNSIGELVYPNHNVDYLAETFRWFDYWLKGIDNGIGESPDVTYYLLGDPEMSNEIGCSWVYSDTWPPADMAEMELFLNDQGELSETAPANSAELSYIFNPSDPVPTKGGNNLSIDAGPYDQRVINSRADVLKFQTEELTAPLRIEGIVKAKLFVASDALDTDFTLKLIDVYPDGREMLVTDGIRRARFREGCTEEKEMLITPGEKFLVEISLPPVAIVFNSGHRLMIAVSSSNYPRFEVNPNTGNTPNDRNNPVAATNTVYFSAENPSVLTLPVVKNMTGIASDEINGVSSEYKLNECYPNPFNGSARISFSIPCTEYTELCIYNISGQLIQTIKRGISNAGEHTVFWNGKNEFGNPVSSGIYFYTLRTPNFYRAKKIIYLK